MNVKLISSIILYVVSNLVVADSEIEVTTESLLRERVVNCPQSTDNLPPKIALALCQSSQVRAEIPQRIEDAITKFDQSLMDIYRDRLRAYCRNEQLPNFSIAEIDDTGLVAMAWMDYHWRLSSKDSPLRRRFTAVGIDNHFDIASLLLEMYCIDFAQTTSSAYLVDKITNMASRRFDQKR